MRLETVPLVTYLCSLAGLIAVANAAESNAPSTPTLAWPGPDTSDGFDWIELTSGEWLKGDFKSLYDGKVEFDSDELDLLFLDWEDIRRVVTQRTHTIRTEGKEEYSGALEVYQDTVKVTEFDGTVTEFGRAELLASVEGFPKEINFWSLKLSAGLTLQKGNTKSSDLTVSGRVRRQTAANRFNLDYLGTHATADKVETENNHRVNSYFDVFLSRKLFVRPVFAEYYRDRFQNLEHQITLGAGLGYHIIDTSKTEWDISAGPAYKYTRFTSVLPGEDATAQTPAFVFMTDYDTELTGWMDFLATYRLNLLNQESGTYTHHAVVGVEIELTSVLDLDVSLVWDRVQRPRARADNTFPERDDFSLRLGVGIDL